MNKMKRFFSLALAAILIVTPMSVPSVKTEAAVQDKSVLVDSDITWKYLDDNTDPGEGQNPASWTLNTYDDGNWKNGKGSFGSNASDPKTGSFTIASDAIVKDSDVVTGSAIVSGSSILVEGENVMAVELHQGRENSSDIFFKLNSLKLEENGSQGGLDIIQKAVSLNVGEDETKRNITWYANDTAPGILQLALKDDMAGEKFPGQNYREFTARVESSNDPGFYSNQLTMSELKAETEYVYRLINGSTVSKVYSFKTGSLGGFSFLLAGDPQIGASGSNMNDSNGWENTLTKSLAQFPDTEFIISAGDQVNTAADENQYAGYLNHDALSAVPVATVIGNHDTASDAYSEHFNNPNVSSYGKTAAGSDYWYVYNNVLFLNLNSNNFSMAEHKAFMKEAINENPDVAWKVVVFHHSIYSVASHAVENDILQRREEYAPVFKDLGIDVVLMGHDHVYVRSYMMDGLNAQVARNADNTPLSHVTDPEGTLYITANSASGSKFYNIQNQEFPYSAVQSQEKVPNISNITVSPSSFKITTYRVSDMSVVDTFEMTRSTVLTGIKEPGNITGVPNGTKKDAQALGLPKTVTLTSDKGDIQTDVKWDVDASSYNPSIQKEQNFSVKGEITLPEGVSNPNNISLDITITVTVDKKAGSGDGNPGNGNPGNGNPGNGPSPHDQLSIPVTEYITVNAAIDKKGHGTAVISEKAVADAIKEGLSAAKEQGKTGNGIEIAIEVKTPDTGKSMSIVLSESSLSKIIQNNVQKLKVDGHLVSLQFDKKAIQEIKRQSTGNVSINIKPAKKLSKEAKSLIKDGKAFDIGITYVKNKKTRSITELGGGNVSINIPYNLKKGEAAGKLFGAYVNDNGKVRQIANSTYESNTSGVIFTTSNLMVYGVVYEKKENLFKDIETHPAKESIDFVASRNILSSETKNHFGPDRELTYGTLAKALAKWGGIDTGIYNASSFLDLEKNSHSPYIEWAYREKIMDGEEKNRFGPDRVVTREQFAVILEKYAKVTGFKLSKYRETINFPDAGEISRSSQTAVKAIQQAGIMDRKENSRFYPSKVVTYAEAALAIHRYAKLVIDPQTTQGWALSDAGQKMYYKDGKVLTGWQKLSDKWYYFHSDGSLAANISK